MTAPFPSLPARDPGGHKGVFGTAAIVGGSAAGGVRMVGAPAFAALGALRAGAGLARVAAPEPVIGPVLTIAPSATGRALPVGPEGGLIAHECVALLDGLLDACGALAIGPGLGGCDGARAMALRAVQQEAVPVVVDADALNALADVPELSRDFHARAVLTPHPGEYRRLAAALRLPTDPTSREERAEAAESLAQRLGCVVVLKGEGTVVSDGHRTWTCERGHACLATAGTGDVLTGVIAGLVAQFVRLPDASAAALPEEVRRALGAGGGPLDLFEAAAAGVLAHAVAGERWAESAGASAGLVAHELAALIPGSVEALRAG